MWFVQMVRDKTLDCGQEIETGRIDLECLLLAAAFSQSSLNPRNESGNTAEGFGGDVNFIEQYRVLTKRSFVCAYPTNCYPHPHLILFQSL
jgi:hypothetical protein